MKSKPWFIIQLMTVSTLLFASLPVSYAADTSQTFVLTPGWNAIYLEVDPETPEWSQLLAGTSVESVWAWNSKIDQTVQYIQDPNELVPELPNWSVYFPPATPQSFLTDLFRAEGGQAYLVNVSGTTAVTLDIVGSPVLPEISWKPESYNLVGFHLDPGNEPFFQAFLESSSAHQDFNIYWLNNGTWEKVLSPATTRMVSGEAYWIYSSSTSNYTGPLSVDLTGSLDLDYGTQLSEKTLKITNLVPNNPVTLATTGNAPLAHWIAPPATTAGWNDLTSSVSIDATPESVDLRLSVNRSNLTAGTDGQSNLSLSDGAGMRIQIPVRVTAPAQHGLWVGSVTINKVNQPANLSAPNSPASTPAEFSFPLLVHLDSDNQARLLKEVIKMWQDGTVTTDTTSGFDELNTPGRYVLVTDRSLLSQFSGAGLRGGEPVGKRMSSTAFNFSTPQSMTGAFGTSLDVSLTVAPDLPTNPFKHKYHPDHDNLDQNFSSGVDEAYEVGRAIQLQFLSQDPEFPNNANPRWGDSEVGGTYRETITGLHKSDLIVEGVFRLRHVSQVDVLNDGVN